MNNISIFKFHDSSVRIQLSCKNELLFCLTDVTEILSIKNANSSRFRLSEDGIHKMYSTDSMNRVKELTFINEPNLYRVIFRSNKAEAVEFQSWVFEEVLPQIRKTGGYQIQKENIDSQKRRYRFDVTITDNLFHGEQITFSGIANTFNAAISGIANNLGYKITGLNSFDEGLKRLL